MPKQSEKTKEPFFYRVSLSGGGEVRITATEWERYDGWLIFNNGATECFRYRLDLVVGWWREAKPRVMA